MCLHLFQWQEQDTTDQGVCKQQKLISYSFGNWDMQDHDTSRFCGSDEPVFWFMDRYFLALSKDMRKREFTGYIEHVYTHTHTCSNLTHESPNPRDQDLRFL